MSGAPPTSGAPAVPATTPATSTSTSAPAASSAAPAPAPAAPATANTSGQSPFISRPSPFGSRQTSQSPNTAGSASPAQGSNAAGGSAFRPLNVRDALSYLDRVKQQFASEYEVYDQFLTIMKQFKTQAIDTPGVIDRVSTLFRGHPSLIQGFNTFLPPGYRIDCHVSSANEAGASNTITVTTPMGVTTRTQDVGGSEAREFAKNQPRAGKTETSSPPAYAAPSVPVAPAAAVKTSKSTASTSASIAAPTPRSVAPVPSASAPSRIISPPQPIPPFNPNKHAAATHATSSMPASTNQPFWQPYGSQAPKRNEPAVFGRGAAGPPGTAAPADKSAANDSVDVEPASRKNQDSSTAGSPAPSQAASATGGQPQVMEFNHAINYVNKIKNRFTKDPDTYKTFLEILQTYQKETRPIQEVYAQVTELFKDAPDLLDEFKAFLPDTSESGAQASGPSAALSAQQKRKDPAPTAASKRYDDGRATGPGKKPVVEEKKKRAAPVVTERAKQTKRTKTQHATATESPPAAPVPPVKERTIERQPPAAVENPPAAPPTYPVQPYGAAPPNFPGAPRMQSAYDAYLTNHRSPQLVQPDEFAFFDRVKRYLDDRSTYTEFLKLLNLFTQEIININTLLEKSLLFFGQNDELVAQFKELVGYDPIKDGRIVGEDWIIDNESAFDRPLVQLHLMKSYGPSYRKLPESEIDLACSGREPLDWSVLNDEWAAFATWASEGSGAHRKNPFEEALYNTEQERHWYSFNIESLLRTIAYLEPIAARIALMSAEERLAFKMPEGFGGTAPSVYERVIRKVYGKDHSWEILAALFDNPAVAVPIVLSRLKQKDEEWKRAEREWNKVWREVDIKNFYRALDHQGIPFKAVDKKATTTSKALTTEIENLRRDKQQKRLDVTSPNPLRPLHQFELGFQNREVFFDALKLIFSYLDRDASGYSAPERARVETFVRHFVPLVFDMAKEEAEANLAPVADGDAAAAAVEEEEVESEAEVPNSEPDANGIESSSDSNSPMTAGGRKGAVNRRGGAADLRKRLLKHAAAAKGSRSRANSPTDDVPTFAGRMLGEQTWITLTQAQESEVAPMHEPLPLRRLNFYTNSTFYCLVRLIHTIYHRLATFKELMTELAAAEKKRQRLSPLAVELGLANPIAAIDTGDNPAANYYEHMLELAEKLFDGEVDQSTYEEQLRYMAGIKAYPLYTLDKLVSTVIKHINTINSDSRCQDLVTLLEKDRARDHITTCQQIAYRMEVEGIIGSDEPLYRLEWIPEAKAMTIQLLTKEDLTLDDAYGSNEKRHVSWVASYALTSATEGVGAPVKAPFLKRNRILIEDHDPQDFQIAPGLEAKVSHLGYQLHFVSGTEDFMYRKKPASPSQSPVQTDGDDAADAVPFGIKRKQRFDKWLEDARVGGLGGPKPLGAVVEPDAVAVGGDVTEADEARTEASVDEDVVMGDGET